MPRPEIPPAALLAMPSYALSILGREARADMAATLPDGLRLGHLAVLGALADRSGQSQRELSEALAIHATDVVAIIDDLFERDLVTREVDQEDRRRRLIRITKRGRLLVTRATTDSGHVTAQLLKNLKPLEQETLVELLRRALET